MNPIVEAALVTGGSTAVVAIAGLWATLAAAGRTTRSQRDIAREARHQERLEQAYIALREYLSRFGDWARSVHPFIGPVQAPDPLPPSERWHIEALVTAYGSEQVQRLLERWAECAARIENADVVIRMADKSRDPGAELDQMALQERQALEGYRKAMWDVADEIRSQIRRELARPADQAED
ncbi:MAG TPA: hypothetical protein VGQ26_07125 [Streptosporangiaceae bacterium]|jgi:hypothetical protein|nr:hypothetical protein [Streptosporangiaceae bacterium]